MLTPFAGVFETADKVGTIGIGKVTELVTFGASGWSDRTTTAGWVTTGGAGAGAGAVGCRGGSDAGAAAAMLVCEVTEVAAMVQLTPRSTLLLLLLVAPPAIVALSTNNDCGGGRICGITVCTDSCILPNFPTLLLGRTSRLLPAVSFAVVLLLLLLLLLIGRKWVP